jgi:hypothetical protein
MSLEELVEPQDTPVFVGVKRSPDGKDKIALYVVDFGEQHPSMYDAMCMLRHFDLDIQPTAKGHMYYVTSRKTAVELTSEVFDQALASASPRDKLADLSRSATPLFSSCFETMGDEHGVFTAARAECEGCWVLVLLTEDATELLILPDGSVYSVFQKKRTDYLWNYV